MRVETDKGGGMDLHVAYYDSVQDMANVALNGKYYRERLTRGLDTKWAGGTTSYFREAAVRGDPLYARRAEKYVDRFSNLAIREHAQVLEYNRTFGMLDFQALQAGEPNFMYGTSWEESDKSPVQIYVDGWTSSAVPRKAMEMRGIAVLALAQALSIYRPVLTRLVTAGGYSPKRMNIIQCVDVPTAPMDLSTASWMLGSPTVFRIGMLHNMWQIAKSDAYCGIPMLRNRAWQRNSMAAWMAAKDNVDADNVVFLPAMFGADEWQDQEFCLNWVKQQLDRFTD